MHTVGLGGHPFPGGGGAANNNKRPRHHLQPQEDAKVQLKQMVEKFVVSKESHPEMEVRFYRNSGKSITKLDYDQVVKTMQQAQYYCEENRQEGNHLLRVYPKDAHLVLPSASTTTPGNSSGGGGGAGNKIRCDLNGLSIIETYCQSKDNLPELLAKTHLVQEQIQFTSKQELFQTVEFADFGFRVSCQGERHMSVKYPPLAGLISGWSHYRKLYRLLNRVRFRHNTLPFFIDLSIVRSVSAKSGFKTALESKVWTAPETYEIELEVDFERVKGQSATKVLDLLRKQIRLILSALQHSVFPIGREEEQQVLSDYWHLIHGTSPSQTQSQDEAQMTLTDRDFIGPTSHTLQRMNLLGFHSKDESQSQSHLSSHPPHLLKQSYCVTDKADGLRCLLFVPKRNNRLYLIDMNMHVVFTGYQLGSTLGTNDKVKYQDCILDGEWIMTGTSGSYLGLFAAFDVYYVQGHCVAQSWFSSQGAKETQTQEIHEHEKTQTPPSIQESGGGQSVPQQPPPKYRLSMLHTFVSELTQNIVSSTPPIPIPLGTASSAATTPFLLECKRFVPLGETMDSLSRACHSIWANPDERYGIDGFVFTPMHASVGGTPGDRPPPMEEDATRLSKKLSWEYSLKWKPPEKNTIDFLVRLVMVDATTPKKVLDLDGKWYQVVELYCGYSRKQHGFLQSPFTYVIQDTLPAMGSSVEEREDLYRPVPFQPTRPRVDPTARFAYIPLAHTKAAMHTEDGLEYFEENTIVEFRYDISPNPNNHQERLHRWIPIRVRHDKTAMLRQQRTGVNCFGNDYRVASQVWETIQRPITVEMLLVQEQESLDRANDDDDTEENAYYLQNHQVITTPSRLFSYTMRGFGTVTKGLRDFHNHCIKFPLLVGTKNLLVESRDQDSKTSEPPKQQSLCLLDMAVGKAGDLSKWCEGRTPFDRIDFVLGIDLHEDNIVNYVDGACARYLQHKMLLQGSVQEFKPRALFVQGDCSKPIRFWTEYEAEANAEADKEDSKKGSTKNPRSAFHDANGNLSKYGEMVQCVFGQGPAGEALQHRLGPGVAKAYNILGSSVSENGGGGGGGFQITSCQFALHYFFQDQHTVHQFMRNVHDCTAVGGYFLATCFDGDVLYHEVLSQVPTGSKYVLVPPHQPAGPKLVEITKLYDRQDFGTTESADTNVGFKIHVFQESIGQGFDEYLVRPSYVQRLMENYGFVLVKPEVAQKIIGIPHATARFQDVYDARTKLASQSPSQTPFPQIRQGVLPVMSDEEKTLSFWNRYYIFQKLRNVPGSSAHIEEMMEGREPDQDQDQDQDQDSEEKDQDQEPQDVDTDTNTNTSTISNTDSNSSTLVPTKKFSIIG